MERKKGWIRVGILTALVIMISGCVRMTEEEKAEMLGAVEIDLQDSEENPSPVFIEESRPETLSSREAASSVGIEGAVKQNEPMLLTYDYIGYDTKQILKAFWNDDSCLKTDEWYGVQFFRNENGSVLEIQKPMVVYKQKDEGDFYSRFRSWTMASETGLSLQPCHLEGMFPKKIPDETQKEIRAICDPFLAKTDFHYTRVSIFLIDSNRTSQVPQFQPRTDLEPGEHQYLVIYQSPVVEGFPVEDLGEEHCAKILYSDCKGILFLQAYATHLYADGKTEVQLISKEEALSKAGELASLQNIDPEAIRITGCSLAYASPPAGRDDHWTLRPVWKLTYKAKPGKNPYPQEETCGLLVFEGDRQLEGSLLLDAQTGDPAYFLRELFELQ